MRHGTPDERHADLKAALALLNDATHAALAELVARGIECGRQIERGRIAPEGMPSIWAAADAYATARHAAHNANEELFAGELAMSCACKVGPGKFEGETALTYLAYQNMGNEDETTGHTDWFRRPFNFDTGGVVEAARAYGYCQPCIDEALAVDYYGLSVTEDEQGFVWLDRWPTQGEFEVAMARAERAENEEDADD